MLQNYKKIFVCIFLCLFPYLFFAKSGNDTQIIKSGHWIYEDLYTICTETKRTQFLSNQPLTIGELKFYLRDIPYDELSDAGRNLYEKIDAFLNKNEDFFSEDELRFYINPYAGPEVYYKSNPDINWTFAYNYKNAFLTIPVLIGFSNYITIELDPQIGKNYPSIQEWWNFTNIPYAGNQFEFLTPRFASGSTGAAFEKWGINFHVGKEGMKIGQSEFGSIIYNDTFETDAYFQLNLFTKWLKYTMDVVQVCNTKYFYLHQLDIRLFRNLKFGMIEGSLLNSSFELRYLNPFMLMHQYGSWMDYDYQMSDIERELYGEGHFCAYLAFTLEYTPVRNVRLYGLYAQNEILDLGGSRSDAALSVPDSLGGQVGVEISIPLDFGYLKPYTEVVYTSPYLYVKQSPDWSLFRTRHDMLTGENISSWKGLPYGPDTFGIKSGVKLLSTGNWKAGGSYTLLAQGENSFSIFDEKALIDGSEVYVYYPSVEYDLADSEEEKIAARDKGRYMWLTGIPEIKHQLAVYASYDVLQNLNIYSQLSYSFVLNARHTQGYFAHGIELIFGFEYSLLK